MYQKLPLATFVDAATAGVGDCCKYSPNNDPHDKDADFESSIFRFVNMGQIHHKLEA
jgi:hypothetical protein